MVQDPFNPILHLQSLDNHDERFQDGHVVHMLFGDVPHSRHANSVPVQFIEYPIMKRLNVRPKNMDFFKVFLTNQQILHSSCSAFLRA